MFSSGRSLSENSARPEYGGRAARPRPLWLAAARERRRRVVEACKAVDVPCVVRRVVLHATKVESSLQGLRPRKIGDVTDPSLESRPRARTSARAERRRITARATKLAHRAARVLMDDDATGTSSWRTGWTTRRRHVPYLRAPSGSGLNAAGGQAIATPGRRRAMDQASRAPTRTTTSASAVHARGQTNQALRPLEKPLSTPTAPIAMRLAQRGGRMLRLWRASTRRGETKASRRSLAIDRASTAA